MMPCTLLLNNAWCITGQKLNWCGTWIQELTADADSAVHVRRSDGDASQKLMQQENLLLRAKVAHAKQMLQRNSDNNQDLLRSAYG